MGAGSPRPRALATVLSWVPPEKRDSRNVALHQPVAAFAALKNAQLIGLKECVSQFGDSSATTGLQMASIFRARLFPTF